MNNLDTSRALQDGYRMRFAKLEHYRNDVWRILCEQYFNKLIPTDAKVLDLGSGWGEFINNIKASQKYAMDLNPETGKRLAADILFLHQDCSKVWEGVQTDSLDVVFTSNFLEHLPDKAQVEQTIDEAYRCLKNEGIVICLSPNYKYVSGQYWDFWDHYIPITDLSISELLKLKGFRIELRLPRFLPYSMSNGKAPPLLLLKLYLKLPILWSIFGKQFLVMGKKLSQ